MNSTKIIFWNVLVICTLLLFLIMAPPISYSVNKFLIFSLGKGFMSSSMESNRHSLHLYRDFPWAKKHFEEFQELPTSYFDYITWRRNDFYGETINIENGLRKTFKPKVPDQNIKEVFWFFGGSTTWGTGVNDFNTFPSIFSRLNSASSMNFGESGYVARQSLAYLQNLYILGSNDKKKIVFYDGVNDVQVRCRSELGKSFSSERELEIRTVMRDRDKKWGFSRTFSQLLDFTKLFVRKTNLKINNDQFFDCDKNADKANFIAKTLVSTWKQAQNLANSNGDGFEALLQPVALFGNPDVSYLDFKDNYTEALRRQYETVYPLIVKYALEQRLNFTDLSSLFDGCNNCYIDFCHVGPQAHEKLVLRLKTILLN